MSLRLDRINRLYLHSEITQPTAGEQKFHDTDQSVLPSSARKRESVTASAFRATQYAAKSFKPRRVTQLTNNDESALVKMLGKHHQAHEVAFKATQKAVENFKIDEHILPI